MKNNITNKDKQGKPHGEQITYHPNENISYIQNYHHGNDHGYIAGFNEDNTIRYKLYFNMGNRIYKEDHWTNLIKIRI